MWTSTLWAVAFTLMLTMTWTIVMAAKSTSCDVDNLGDPINVLQVLGGTGYIYKMFQTNPLGIPANPVHHGRVFTPGDDNLELSVTFYSQSKDKQCTHFQAGPYNITDHGYKSRHGSASIITHDDSHVVLYTTPGGQLTIFARNALPVVFGNIPAAILQLIKEKCEEDAGKEGFYPLKFLPGNCLSGN